MGKYEDMYLDQVVSLAQGGDSEAVRFFIEKYTPFCIKECKKYYIPSYEYEDLLQHCYLSIIKAIAQYKVGKNMFTSYVMTSIKNNLGYLLRGEIKHFREVQDVLNGECICNYDFNLEEEVIAYDEVLRLREAMYELPPKDKAFIEVCFFKSRNFTESAKKIGCNYQSLLHKKKKILAKLEKAMERPRVKVKW